MFDYYSNPESFKEANGYTIDEVWYPRVTKIISIKAKPALYRFYGEMASFGEAQSITQKSATEGTKIHSAVEDILLGKSPEIDPLIKPAIDAFLTFFEQKNIQVTPDFVEKRVVSFNHRYAGTVDALALIEGKFGVLDIKTSQAIYRDYNLQTSAYIDALKDQHENLQTRWILKIDQIQTCNRCSAIKRIKGGREKVRKGKNSIPCPGGEHEWSELRGDIEFQEFPYWQNDFEAFLGAKKLWEWENDSWLRKIGYL